MRPAPRETEFLRARQEGCAPARWGQPSRAPLGLELEQDTPVLALSTRLRDAVACRLEIVIRHTTSVSGTCWENILLNFTKYY